MLKRLLALAVILALLIPTAALADLKYGDQSNEVLAVQKRLYYYGYYNNGFDGLFGSGTYEGVKLFQEYNNLPNTGKVDADTLNLLNSDTAVHKSSANLPAGGNRTMKRNDRGEDVRAAQQRLLFYGYYNGKLDGIFGAGTEAAVKRFQQNNPPLVVDGKIGSRTYAMLFSDSANPYDSSDPTYTDTLKRGDQGDEVAKLQQRLLETYYYIGPCDGAFGSNVEAAVKSFQTSVGLSADGKVGPTTYGALFGGAAIFNGGIPRRSLSSGMRGYDVFVLQMKLCNINYMSAIVTPGYFDSATVTAVSSFQKDNNLTVDGKVGSIVRRYLWPSTVDQEDIVKEEALDGNPAVVTKSQPTLRKGSQGNEVANAQMRLKAAGFLLGNADGVYGDATVKAVKQLQKFYNITPQDGIIGPTTWAYINNISANEAEPSVVLVGKKAATTPTKALKKGANNSNVAKMQAKLYAAGLLTEDDIDGIFGPKTKAALESFQKSALLTIDGIAGAQTLSTLNEKLDLIRR